MELGLILLTSSSDHHLLLANLPTALSGICNAARNIAEFAILQKKKKILWNSSRNWSENIKRKEVKLSGSRV
jgi:hypothetical protein